MTAIKLVIGFDGEDKPFPVYVGRSGSDAEKAKAENTTAARFESFSGIVGIRKRNPNYKEGKPSKTKKE